MQITILHFSKLLLCYILKLNYESNLIVYFDIEKWIFITKYLKKEKKLKLKIKNKMRCEV